MFKIEGEKVNMTQVFLGDGKVVPVSIVRFLTIPDQNELKEGLPVVIRGRSKGRGYTGVVKRHHFRGGPATHGQSDRHRAPGSIGCRTTPGRVYKGKRMAGRSGGTSVTVKSSRIVEFDIEKKLIKVLGPVPGAPRSKVLLEVG